MKPRFLKRKMKSGKARKLLVAAALLLLGGVAAQAQVRIGGSIYGGGEAARVTGNDTVIINGKATDTIFGSVYGGGEGATANVLGNTLVDMRTGIVEQSIYGGGELGSVGTFTAYDTVVYVRENAPNDTVFVPNTCVSGKGLAKVLISGGMVGTDTAFMPHTTTPGYDIYGYVFCGGQGDADSIANPHVLSYGVVDSTYLEISGGLITASAYGGSENGLVLRDTRVKMTGGQIGTGHYKVGENHFWDGVYDDTQWTQAITAVNNGTLTDTIANQFHNCDHWTYDRTNFTVYDIFAEDYDSDGGSITATNGHSFFGNLFGGGSGYYPIAKGVWRRTAGRVKGNVVVDIEGGHILTCVYGGNEYTDVLGKVTVNMKGGTLGVPRTVANITDNPVTGMLFGAGMGDPRKAFNTWTNVPEVEVNVTDDAVIFGSIYGGGEDGHVTGDVHVTVDEDALIGIWGTSGFDGNVFGAGRGFAGKAYTAGTVKGNVVVDIEGGKMLGSIYGGGRLASVGLHLVDTTDITNYGKFVEDDANGTYGYVTVNINGGIIGNTLETPTGHTKGGNVYGGSMGRILNVDLATENEHWPGLARVKQAMVNLKSGSADIKGNVYGGGELGIVRDSSIVAINGGIVDRNVYGGGYGSSDTIHKDNDSLVHAAKLAGLVQGHTLVEMKDGQVKGNIYGGGELASVGMVKTDGTLLNGNTNVVISGGSVGVDNIYTANNYFNNTIPTTDIGHVYGGGEGYPNDTLHKAYGNVNNTMVTLSGTGRIYGSVFGGGSNSHVLGNDSVFISAGALLGTSGVTSWDGNVFGGGQGSGYYKTTGSGANAVTEFHVRKTCGRVEGNTYINMDGGTLMGSIFGGGRLALTGVDVNGDYNNDNTKGLATIYVDGGTLGLVYNAENNTNDSLLLKSDESVGDVFGSGKGDTENYDDVWAGRVTNTNVIVTGDAVVRGCVFGGGEMASVGYWNNSGAFANGTGVSTVTIGTQGTDDNPEIGLDYEFTLCSEDNPGSWTIFDTINNVVKISHTATGNVYGAGQGDVDPDAPHWISMARSNTSSVNIYGGTIKSNVYGGAEQGTVQGNSSIAVYGGTIGTANLESDTLKPGNVVTHGVYHFGSVYGGGYGSNNMEKHWNDLGTVAGSDTTFVYAPAIAGRTFGNASVTFSGGKVVQNVFGGGDIASVGKDNLVDGKTTVVVNGGEIGFDQLYATYDPYDPQNNGGHVFGAGRGINADAAGQFNPYCNVNNTKVTVSNGAKVWGSVFGGGAYGHVIGNDTVYIASNTIIGTQGKTSMDGNVYGGGRGNKYNLAAGRVGGNTFVEMTSGQLMGCIYGGGHFAITGVDATGLLMQDGDDHGNTKVLVKGGIVGNNAQTNNPDDPDETVIETFADFSMGSVYGGGKGDENGVLGHQIESALLMGSVKNTEVHISEDDPDVPTHVYGIVYGGGEVANVGKYTWSPLGNNPFANINIEPNTGWARVTIDGGIIGGDRSQMRDSLMSYEDDDNYWTLYNDDLGYVYGGGEGIADNPNNYDLVHTAVDGYTSLINLLATVNHTEVTIDTTATTKPWIKGSVFGGSEAGHVRGNTLVTIKGGQIGAGAGVNGDSLYANYQFINPLTTPITDANALRGTVHWDFGEEYNGEIIYKPFDLVLLKQGILPSDGKSWFGNVFGGGSGWFPYVVDPGLSTAHCAWNPLAGKVWGNTHVVVEGGHILNNVYGANESTDVGGKATVEIKGGTVGVPRTSEQIQAQPCSGFVFGGGSGDPREVFDTITLVASTEVTVTGGIIYGSVFGGAEDGHVLGNTKVTVNENDNPTIIGCSGLSTADGNIYGGGRNFLGENPKAGRVEGNIEVNMSSGHLQGSIFGGGRMAVSGIDVDGNFIDSNHGNVTINVSGGTIGNDRDNGIHLLAGSFESAGDIFGAGKGDTKKHVNILGGRVTNATVNITGSPHILGSVYGGGEMASVGWWDSNYNYTANTGKTKVTIGSGSDNPVIGTALELNPSYINDSYTVGDSTFTHSPWTILETNNGVKKVFHSFTGNVIGGSRGDVFFDNWTTTTPNNWMYMGRSNVDTVIINSGTIMCDVYGGSEQGTVDHNTYVKINGGTIGTIATATDNTTYRFGNVYGGGYGSDDTGDNSTQFTYINQTTTADVVAGRVKGNTTVDVLDGTMNADVFGGAAFAYVDGDVEVNIGAMSNGAKAGETYSGNATILGRVFGANNRSGTPLGNVDVNVYKTGHTSTPDNYYPNPAPDDLTALAALAHEESNFALKEVYGGSNMADYSPDPDANKVATVHVYQCDDNTIYDLYGGSNAANVNTNTFVIIDGGRMHRVFGGGNGAGENNPGANIHGTGTTHIYAGLIDELYGGSNTLGQVDTVNLQIEEESASCEMLIGDVFGGGNEAPLIGEIVTTIQCGAGHYDNFYGGANRAPIYGNVTVNIKGGNYNNLFAGSRGVLDDETTLVNEAVSADIMKYPTDWDEEGNPHGYPQVLIDYMRNHQGQGLEGTGGNVTLNLYGGYIAENAYGGSDANGRIEGKITVNVLDTVKDCGLYLKNLYGAGRNTAYTPDLVNGNVINSPEINVIHGVLDGNIYGGGEGATATTTANPVINYGYNPTMANFQPIADGLFNPDTARVTVNTIFGGGNNAIVVGSPKVTVSKIGTDEKAQTLVLQNVFGGGSGSTSDYTYGEIQGNDTVVITGGWIKNNVYGGGENASTTGNAIVNISGGQIGVEQAGQENITCGLVFGGGLGLAGGDKYYYGNVDSTKVTISGDAYIINTVFGGGDNGHVLGSTMVEITGGTVGKPLTLAEMITDSLEHVKKHVYTGSVLAGGRGTTPIDNQNHYNDTTGRVFGNAHVIVSGGYVRHAVYGGGGLSSVGTYETDASGNITGFINNTGKTYVTVNGNAVVGPKEDDLTNPSDEELAAARVILNAPSLTKEQYIDTVFKYLGGNEGWVFGAGCGLADDHASLLNYNDSSFVNISGNAQVVGSVFGGGENGHVWSNTDVKVSGGIIGGSPLHGEGAFTIPAGEYKDVTVHLKHHEDELHENQYGYGHNIFRGNVYGGGKGTDTITGGSYSMMAGRVFGNTNVTVSDSAVIYNRVYGGGDLASVGQFTYYPGAVPAGVALRDSVQRIAYVAGTGVTNVVVGGGSIGTNGNNNGDVFGGGRGLAGYHGNLKGSANGTDDADQVVRLAYVGETNVEVYGNVQIKRSVYGGSANGHVYGDSHVTISGGCIGDTIPGEGGAYTIPDGWKGSVYGGGGGAMHYKKEGQNLHLSITSGRVYGNTHVTVSDSAWILNNVYGGGAIATVGTYDLRDNATDTIAMGTGETHVHIKGGIIGYDGKDNGMVYGSGRGYIEPYGSFMDSLSYADTTFIVIGEDPSQSPLIRGSVFGSGENGHVFRNTYITMHGGIVEQSVYGSGSGIDTIQGGIHNPIGGITAGSTQVNIQGGLVKRNVYGGGEMASVGKNTEVNIEGGTVGEILYSKKTGSTVFDTIIHVANSGKVFGGGQGVANDVNAALVSGNSNVNIKSGHVLYSVYGGGELGSVIDTAFVTVTGGQVGPAPKMDEGYNIPIGLNGIDGYVFGGGQGEGNDPISVSHPYGAYYQHANVGTAIVTVDMPMTDTVNNRIWGSIFGGAEDGHVIRNAHVYYLSGLMGTTGTTSYDGNIFGGGRNFNKKNYTAGRVGGNINVEMSGGQIYGSIFGGGRLGIVGLGEIGPFVNDDDYTQAMQDGPDHGNIKVVVKGGKVGNEKRIVNWTKSSMGDVFGGGKGDMVGVAGHPEASALLISLAKNTEVIIKDSIKNGAVFSRPIIYGSVFGGGEVANVGNFTWKQRPGSSGPEIYDIELRDVESGLAKVTVSGGIIGAETMRMRPDLATGTYNLKYNDDVGHVFGGGEGLVMHPDSCATVNPAPDPINPGPHNNISLVDLMATVGHTEVTICDSAFVKGSVYGGSMNGHLMNDALVTISGGQVGCGQGKDRPYTQMEFDTCTSLTECPHWDFGDGNGNYYPYDPILVSQGKLPADGRTWFGNVFGGGSGYYPYVSRNQADDADSLIWNPAAGRVEGQAKVVITGGHILSNVYGGGEINDVLDSVFVEMSAGTIGVPRTYNGVMAHPLTCSLSGAGKGDPRTNFNTYTMVKNASVDISGGRIYGSVFGGGEDGHVLENADVTISGNTGTNAQAIAGQATKIGTFGYTELDGNVFGAGRGFAGYALTAGVVAGNVEVNIEGGEMLGSVYGGGRLGSVGTYLVPTIDPNYGHVQDGADHGYATVNISGGIIGNDYESITHVDYEEHTKGGNVFGGAMGRLTTLNETEYSDIWAFLAKVKQTKVNITGGVIKASVYGGGELGTVHDSATVIINGNDAVIWRDVFGGGFGSDSTTVLTCSIPDSTITSSPMEISGRVYGNTLVKLEDGWVKKSVYGGGELASVGTIDSVHVHEADHPFNISWPYYYRYADNTGTSNVQITGGRVGISGKDYMGPWMVDTGSQGQDTLIAVNVTTGLPLTSDEIEDQRQDNGDVYGGGKGKAFDRYTEAHCANVDNAVVTINISSPATPTNYKDTELLYDCITGAVYGGAEDGHVNHDARITLDNGLIGHAIYGGGKGKGKYKTRVLDASTGNYIEDTTICSVSAGRLYGNTHITVNDGNVVRSVFGGGNLASVGIGSYAGGVGDYNPEGYGEVVTTMAQWADTTNSGHTYVNIYGGTLGMLPENANKPDKVFKDNIPYGSVFGGSRGQATPEVTVAESSNPDQLYESRPDVFYGYVNSTHVKIGADGSSTGPRLYGSAYGGAQDGHVRWTSNITVNSGEIGVDFGGSESSQVYNGSNPDTVYWVTRGNVYGGGSGIGVFETKVGGETVENYSSLAGSVTQSSNVTINGGLIHRNVYGGGNLATVGPPRLTQGQDCDSARSRATVTINATDDYIGTNTNDGYGGYVYGGSRGLPNLDSITAALGQHPYENYALVSHTLVNINSAKIKRDVFGGGENGQVATAGGDDTHTSTVNINGTSKIGLNSANIGNVYGGGQGIYGEDYYLTDTLSGRVRGITTVNMNGGEVTGNVYGAGRLGVTYGESYANMSGGTVDENVYGGAYGKISQVHVLGVRTANMRGGLVKNSVYGGSFTAKDARVFKPKELDQDNTTTTVSVVNYSGGHTERHVFGAGDHGHTHGSTYVFIGTNAIMNAPNHTAGTMGANDPYDADYFNDHENLYIDLDVWAGADFGLYEQGTTFGTYTITGRSDVYIDGTDYDTENPSPTSTAQTNFMMLGNSVFGCGTLNDGGHQGKQIMIRNYGHDVENLTQSDPEPFSNATRALYTIQYADSVILESTHVHLYGRGKVNLDNASEKYAIYNIFGDVRVVNGSSLFMDKPIDNIGNLHSLTSTNLNSYTSSSYPDQPVYAEVPYTALSPNIASQSEEIDNKIRLNNGTSIWVRIVDPTNNISDYGAVNGFFHMMTDPKYSGTAYARPKQSADSWNQILGTWDNPNDGGFVGYRAADNIYDVNGLTVDAGVQIPYENHAPSRGNSMYFRVWRFNKDGVGTTDVVLIAEGEVNNDGYGTYLASVTLPPINEAGAYYRIKRTDGPTPTAVINYGSEIKTVNAGFNAHGSSGEWIYYDNTQNQFLHETNGGGHINTDTSFMHSYPNNVFGLTAIPSGGLANGGETVLINKTANPGLISYIAEWQFTNTNIDAQMDFVLTYSKTVNNNYSWDPLAITFQQVKDDGNGGVTVLEETTVYVQIVTKTSIEQENNVKTYALMTHSPGTGDTTDIYRAKVLLPSYVLSGGAEISHWHLKNVEWIPNTGTPAEAGQAMPDHAPFDQYTLVQSEPHTYCKPYIDHTAPHIKDTCDFVGMTMAPTVGFDNVPGWQNDYTLIDTVDLGAIVRGTATIPAGGIYLGETKGKDPVSFEFDLHYFSDINVGVAGNATMGVVRVTTEIDHYEGGDPNDNYKQEVVFNIEVFRRGKGKGFYIDGVNGDFMYSGMYPDAAQPSFAGILYFGANYEPVDSIYIVNKVTADAVENLSWSTPYDLIKMFRYNGGHQLYQDVPGHDEFLYYRNYLTDYGNNPAYKGALVDVVSNMNVRSAFIDGAYTLEEWEGQPAVPGSGGTSTAVKVADHVIADAPLFNILDGGTLTINGANDHPMELLNNYNQGTNGGAVNIENGGTLWMNQNASLKDNYVQDHLGGGAYLEGNALMVVSDSVMINTNKQVTIVNSTPTYVDQNVYLNDYETVIQVGTGDGTDTYGALDKNSRIGVTKTDWGTANYLPVVYTDYEPFTDNLLSPYGSYVDGQIIYDELEEYGLLEYPERYPNNDPYCYDKLYYVKTWVNQITAKPSIFNASEIDTPEELAWAISVANGYNGETGVPSTNFTVTGDIDMSQYIWVPIGDTAKRYSGTFEGNGYLVSGVTSQVNFANKGMFGSIDSIAKIQNLQAEVEFFGRKGNNVGGLVGEMYGGEVSNCESAGYIEGGNNTNYMGGLVGRADTTVLKVRPVIHSSFAVDTIHGLTNSTKIGGLVGENNGDLVNSYSNNVIVNEGNTDTVGGLVAINRGRVENCYSVVDDQTYSFAYQNVANKGVIQYCYSNRDNYLWNYDAPLYHGTYGTVKDRGTIGYMYDDNAITLASGQTNGYVPANITYNDNHSFKWNGLLSVLNQWVDDNSGYTPWFRPTTSTINGDLPILAFPKDSTLATLDVDGRFLRYSSELDTLLRAYADTSSSIFLYGNATEVERVPTVREKVFVNENAVLMQAASTTEDFGNTTVGITFDNSCRQAVSINSYTNVSTDLTYDWHLLSTPLRNAPLGITYNDAIAQNWWVSEDDGQVTGVSHSYMPDDINLVDLTDPDHLKWDFYCYYEPQYHWINFKRNSQSHYHYDYPHGFIDYVNEDTLVPGKGYMMAISKEHYLSNTGSLNKKVEIYVTGMAPDGEGYNKGSNLVGNPYQAYLDLTKVTGGNSTLTDFYIYDADQGTATAKGVYAPYTETVSENPRIPSRYIHPHQGFFVMYNGDDSLKMTIDPSMAGTTKSDEHSYFRSQANRINYPVVNLIAENDKGNCDLAIVELGRPELGGVKKTDNLRNANFQLYTRLEGNNYGLLFTPVNTQRIPLFFKTQEDGKYTLTWDTHNGIYSKLYLIDNLTGVQYDMLTHDNYKFEALASDYAARFYIVFSVVGTVEIEDEGNGNFAYFDGTNWVINGSGQLELLDVTGRVLYSDYLSGDQSRVSLNNYAAGTYMLRLVNTNKNVKAQKIVIY